MLSFYLMSLATRLIPARVVGRVFSVATSSLRPYLLQRHPSTAMHQGQSHGPKFDYLAVLLVQLREDG